jgi:ubiquitin carboxyl-terminal hydrolase 34
LAKNIKIHNSWSYTPSSEGKAIYGYLGIDNLGCICYMIAMLQQFFHIPTFRYGILGADDKRPPTNLDDVLFRT